MPCFGVNHINIIAHLSFPSNAQNFLSRMINNVQMSLPASSVTALTLIRPRRSHVGGGGGSLEVGVRNKIYNQLYERPKEWELIPESGPNIFWLSIYLSIYVSVSVRRELFKNYLAGTFQKKHLAGFFQKKFCGKVLNTHLAGKISNTHLAGTIWREEFFKKKFAERF